MKMADIGRLLRAGLMAWAMFMDLNVRSGDNYVNVSQSLVGTSGALALAHLVVTVAGSLQTERIVLAGEDVGHLVASPVFDQTLEDRLRDETGSPRLELDISVEPSGFTDWARGAAVVGIQQVLGAL